MAITFKDKYGDLTNQVYKGKIVLNKMYLTSLEGCPKECGDFDLSDNELTSLKLSPQMTDDFLIRRNKLTSLVGGAKHVEGNYSVRNNHLSTLAGIATYIGGNLDLRGNRFKDLETILFELGESNTKVFGTIKTDFADFHQIDIDTYKNSIGKMGKFKDLLHI